MGVFTVADGIGTFRYAPSLLDERATHCLLCLLFAAQAEVPIRRVTVHAPGIPGGRVLFDPSLDDPYPALWPSVPFPYVIEESESESRVLILSTASSTDRAQREAIKNELLGWGAAVVAGAFGSPGTSTTVASIPLLWLASLRSARPFISAFGELET
jgi:hypothetical protein